MHSQSKISFYQDKIADKFREIFHQKQDETPDQSLYSDITNRQEILFMQYDMEKKGKKFGITQHRLFKIEGQQLYQVDKNNDEKLLPFPNHLSIEKNQGHNEWDSKYEQYEARTTLFFDERTDIHIYFRSIVECNEISALILALMRQKLGKNFHEGANLHKEAIIQFFVAKLVESKHHKKSLKDLRIQTKITEAIVNNFNDKRIVQQFVDRWISRALFGQTIEDFTIRMIELESTDEIKSGDVKIWVGGSVSKRLVIKAENCGFNRKSTNYLINFGNDFEVPVVGISSSKEVQFEIEEGGKLWKGERMTVCDLRRLAQKYGAIQINLKYKNQLKLLSFKFNFPKYKLKHQTIQITPKHYRLIDELYLSQPPRYQLSEIHLFYSKKYIQFLTTCPYYCSFNHLKSLFDYLKIQQIIDKFYLIYPFKNYNFVQNKGSFIFQYLLKDYDNQHYYDVQKLMWEFGYECKPILTALKVFDQNPKFNFTQPFFYTAKRMLEIATFQTISRWNNVLFPPNVKSIEAVAFFLTLGIIKAFPSIYMYQQFSNKRALPINSLLFHYTLRKHLPLILKKITKIQLNIQAYFGQQFINLLSKIFQGETFCRILVLLLEEKKVNPTSQYMTTLIAAFMSIIEFVDKYECSYASGEHYIITFEEICRTLPCKFQFFSNLQGWRIKCLEESQCQQFSNLVDDMMDFYLNNAYSGDLGQISQQIYQQFTSYRYKSQADIRKIYLVIDKIQLPSHSQALTFSIYQEANRLYSHEFKGVNLQQMQHFIQIELYKLEQLNIICNNQTISYSCKLDPKEFPSNYYFHFALPLVVSYQLYPNSNYHIFLQAYIKDSCEVDTLENPIPQKYKTIFLQKDVAKQDILFCKKFIKTFRMRENNFNLLYLKLGWYANHYLIPDDRLIGIDVLTMENREIKSLFDRMALIGRYTRIIYGKAIYPYPSSQKDILSVDLIKEGILANLQSSGPRSANYLSQTSQYSSASRLLCYILDNFAIPNSMQFIQFYQRMNQKLPLISYLSYQPLQYYSIPSFTFQIISETSVCVAIVSQKGQKIRRDFKADEIKQIETLAAEYGKLPEQVQLGYLDDKIHFDEFLYWLRLTILSKVIDTGKKREKKSKCWPNTLVCSGIHIPNYLLHNFYQLMNQTKQIVQLQFRQTKKSLKVVNYNDFGLIRGRWTKINCIACLKSPNHCYYYTLEPLERKKYLLRKEDYIRTSQEAPLVLLYSDEELTESLEVVTYELANKSDL